jgi:hypothetical protein
MTMTMIIKPTITLLKRMALGVVFMLALVAAGCEDAPPTDYVPEYVVQSYLLVDEPIQGVVLSRSQPVTDTFRVDK